MTQLALKRFDLNIKRNILCSIFNLNELEMILKILEGRKNRIRCLWDQARYSKYHALFTFSQNVASWMNIFFSNLLFWKNKDTKCNTQKIIHEFSSFIRKMTAAIRVLFCWWRNFGRKPLLKLKFNHSI